ncbi:MAG TPA: ABC transporter substrate-binding protein [Chthoniobacterales bacterium]|jgi:trehalose/maltose transport system substrate-binding protein|nr:ABC transporter substrate-binding protein [Chthoniobacterales bacterium]
MSTELSRRNFLQFVGGAAGIALLGAAATQKTYAAGVKIRLAGDSDVGQGGRWMRARAQEWADKTGNQLEYISRPNSSTETLSLYDQYWAAQSPDVDVYLIDVIWPGIAAPHAIDLNKFFDPDEIKEFFPRIIENNTVDGKLVGLPLFTDAGILYYRTDLLEKYDFKQPPETWEELTDIAKKIQDGERKAGKPDFQGFVFQGAAYEGLTCDGLEWIYSYNGGTIIDRDKRVTINNPNAIHALEVAKSWVGTIAPRGVTVYQEEQARNLFQGGDAAFMRNWPYAYGLGNAPQSPIAGKLAVTVLPKGGADGRHAATLGGWQLMVSKYSKNPGPAAGLVGYLCSSDVQKRQALDLSNLPTRPTLYKDKEILAKLPWFAGMLEVFNNAVARPSTVLKTNYNEVSTAFFQHVNNVLNGEESAKDAVAEIERTAKRFLPSGSTAST